MHKRLSDNGLQYNALIAAVFVSDLVGLYCNYQSPYRHYSTHTSTIVILLALGGQKSTVKYKYSVQAL